MSRSCQPLSLGRKFFRPKGIRSDQGSVTIPRAELPCHFFHSRKLFLTRMVTVIRRVMPGRHLLRQLHDEDSVGYHCAMFIGNRRTKHSIHAFRCPGTVVVIPKDATLHDVRTSAEPGYRFPTSMGIMARTNPSMHIFEYAGETLCMHFVHGLMEATTEVDPKS